MKSLVFLSALLLSVLHSFGQSSEFTVDPNGLIYSDTTMKQLAFIVDSLNLKFKVCDLNTTYYSKYQARAHYISLEKGDIKAARKDIEQNIPFEEFIQKYPQCEVEREMLIIKFRYRNYDNQEVVEFNSVPLDGGYGPEFRFEDKPEMYDKPVQNTWHTSYSRKTEYSEESLYGFYFATEFTKQRLPEVYARMVQYSDCMIDTSTQVLIESTEGASDQFEHKESPEVAAFLNYVHSNTDRPEYDYSAQNTKEDYEKFIDRYNQWNASRLSIIDSTLSKDSRFISMIRRALDEVLVQGGSNDEFEEYVARYYSPKTALELKRRRRVIGGCSMDDSPRIHAMNIAVLSAETVSWEVFLRAHLDIMNDRFDRITDGSYAWGRRATYIRELEELDINVANLLLGISLRVENPSMNHYYGSIGRLGRALAETRYAPEMEEKMLGMIQDTALDDYNRILIYYLFRNYNHYIEDEAKKKQNAERLKQAVATLPAYLAERIQFDED